MKTNKKAASGLADNRKRILAITLIMLIALLLAGCQTGQTTSQPTSQTQTPGPAAITLFGATEADRQQLLALPCDALFIEWLARDGQKLVSGDPVFKIDRAQWVRQSAQLENRRQSLAANLAVLQFRIDQLDRQVELWQAAGKADLENGLAILEKLVRATSQARRNSYATELYEFLTAIDGLSLYQNLVNLTRDGAQVKNMARPILAQQVADLEAAADGALLQVRILQQQFLAGQADLAEVTGQLAMLDDWLTGKIRQELGYLNPDGNFIYAGGECLLERGAVQDGAVLQAGQPVAAYTSLPVSLVSVLVDEQLIPQVAIGATVQISPLYDRTVVWIGSVTFISEKAVIMNGETVIPVLVSTDEILPGPGYTVIAKILPVVP